MALETNLEAYWKLEEASGSTRVDSKNSNNLTETAGIPNTTGKLNNAADFQGSAYLKSSGPNVPCVCDTFSVSFWAQFSSLPGAQVKWMSHAISNFSVGWELIYQTSNRVFFNHNGKWSFQTGTGVLTAGQFDHIVITRTNSGAASIYVNGTQEATAGSTGTTNFATDRTNQQFNLGAGGNGSNPFTGQIDEVGYWSRALTQAEVTHLYSVGQGAFYDNTVPNQFDPEVPICWNYTAPYKGSDRRFKLSGPGAFPKSLNVPGNVDTSQGKMIDNGQLIDPDEYDIL